MSVVNLIFVIITNQYHNHFWLCFTEVGLVAKQKWVKANRDTTANSRFPLVIGLYKTTNTYGILNGNLINIEITCIQWKSPGLFWKSIFRASTNYQDINHIPRTLAGKWNKAFIKVSDWCYHESLYIRGRLIWSW